MAWVPHLDTDGLPYFDDVPEMLWTNGTTVHSADGTVVPTRAGVPLQAVGGAPIGQPALSVKIAALLGTVRRAATATMGTATAPPGPRTVARTPARVDRNAIDYSTKTGTSLFDRATKNLFTKTEDMFDLNGEDLMAFTDAVNRRSSECGWELFMIPNSAATPVAKHLITQYGELTMAEVTTHATVYMTATPVTRVTQEDAQLYSCIMNSITKEAIGELMLKEAEFTINNEGCGVLLLRVIISESQVDTVATTNLLLGMLTSGLPDIMEKHGGNIKAFNNEVKNIARRVKRRGTDPGSILPQLLRVYQKVEDKSGAFFRYIETLNNNYTDGVVTLSDTILMDKALTKYEELNENKQFEMKNQKDETILSLEAKVSALSGVVNNLKSNGGGKNTEKESEPTGTRDRTHVQKDFPQWMTKAPKEGQPTTKKVDDKTYHWCEGNGGKGGPGHGPRWVIHDPADCKTRKAIKNEKEKEESKTPPNSESARETQGTVRRTVGWSTNMLATVANLADSDDEE